jgi:hypothetical protein
MHCLREGRRSLQRWRVPYTTASRLLTVDAKQTLQLPARRASKQTSSVLAVHVLHASGFFGRILSETGHIELSAQKRDVKMVILERV